MHCEIWVHKYENIFSISEKKILVFIVLCIENAQKIKSMHLVPRCAEVCYIDTGFESRLYYLLDVDSEKLPVLWTLVFLSVNGKGYFIQSLFCGFVRMK